MIHAYIQADHKHRCDVGTCRLKLRPIRSHDACTQEMRDSGGIRDRSHPVLSVAYGTMVQLLLNCWHRRLMRNTPGDAVTQHHGVDATNLHIHEVDHLLECAVLATLEQQVFLVLPIAKHWTEPLQLQGNDGGLGAQQKFSKRTHSRAKDPVIEHDDTRF